MTSKEKKKEATRKWREKNPERYREQTKKDNDKRRAKELIEKYKPQIMMIAKKTLFPELNQKLKKAEEEAAKYAKEYQRAKRANDNVKEYLTYCLRDTPFDTILVDLDFIYNKEYKNNDEN